MATLLVLYRQPQDTHAFDRHYLDVHVPLALRLPGLRSLRADRAVGGDPALREYYLAVRMEFDDREAMRAALRSPEGQAAGHDLAQFATDGYLLMQLEPMAELDAVHPGSDNHPAERTI